MSQPTTDTNQPEREDDWLQKQFDYVLQKATGKTYPGQRQKKVEEAKAAILLHEQEAIAKAVETALVTERKVTLGFSNDTRIARALDIAEKNGYEKCNAYWERKTLQTKAENHNG